MLKVILFALSVLSVTSYACPNLQGSWSCTNPGHPNQFLNVDQQVANGTTTYAIGSSTGSPQTLIADGQDHSQQDPSTGGQMTSSAACTSETHVAAKVKVQATAPPVNMSGTFDYTLVSATSMTVIADVTFSFNGQTGHEVQTLTCTHN